MDALGLVLAAASVMGLAGLACLLAGRAGRARDVAFAVLMAGGGLAGAAAALATLLTGSSSALSLPWLVPLGHLGLRLDALSAVFLLPVFLVPALGAVFGTAYWSETENPRSAARLRVSYGLLAGAMALVLVASDGVLLLMAWEVMALSAFFSVAADDEQPEVRDAAWVYLVATHLGTLALIAFFALLFATTGSFLLQPGAALAAASPAARTALFLLGLAGFGLKAGIMPLHVWLPGAHAGAPSHVSAVLSGVMLKVGLYGILRVCWMLPDGPAWWGWLIVGLGAASAVLGIGFAVAQADFKRLLAYSSIEHVGVIAMGIGLAVVGRALHAPALEALGLAGALLHVWNHALFKPLLFFVAGGLLHATGTRRMDLLGGLAPRMRRTALLALVACLAVAALPPLNGFASEWLIYRAVIEGVGGATPGDALGLAAALLALVLAGGLALAAFVRFHGTVFLGEPRSPAGRGAHEAPAAMLFPMAVLALVCLVLGVLPQVALVPLRGALQAWAGSSPPEPAALAAAAGSLCIIAATATAATLAGLALLVLLRQRARSASARATGTWDCGYAAPSPRMQYGASSLARSLVDQLDLLLRPRRLRPAVERAFPRAASFASEVPDVVLDRLVLPAVAACSRALVRVRRLQHGKVQVYVLYIAITILGLLLLA